MKSSTPEDEGHSSHYWLHIQLLFNSRQLKPTAMQEWAS